MKKAKAVLSLLMALVMALTGIITAFAADLEEKEPNNEMAKATVFALADTIKGKGVSFMEGKSAWHGKAIPDAEFAQAMQELGGNV